LFPQRDPIQTAKSVATVDYLSNGRFIFGTGVGWNQAEIENHGTNFKTRLSLTRERIEAMREIWTKSKAEYHGKYVNFEPMMTWPKPVQKPPPSILVGGGGRMQPSGRWTMETAGCQTQFGRPTTFSIVWRSGSG
jgi:alkanesulfonate monooxygenase SsuD/methylene tetrahydromethanopterin reductase-like flavin-dependent oxidoreductase (luciferase family)